MKKNYGHYFLGASERPGHIDVGCRADQHHASGQPEERAEDQVQVSGQHHASGQPEYTRSSEDTRNGRDYNLLGLRIARCRAQDIAANRLFAGEEGARDKFCPMRTAAPGTWGAIGGVAVTAILVELIIAASYYGRSFRSSDS